MLITDLVYIDATGYHFADYPAFLAFKQEQYRAIYGADVYLESDSADGQFLAVLAKADYDLAALGASIYNSFSPVTAQGVGLARLVKINGLTKRIATHSTVDLTIVGAAGTTIINGVAQDTLGQKWDLPASVVIPGGGTTLVTATAQEIGALTAAPASVTQIFTPTLGWQTVNNIDAATPGEPVETDAELRLRQAASTSDPSLTVFDGTVGAVANLPGVTAVQGYENDTASTDSNGIPSHSISLVVAGGDSAEIAQEIALHKTPGTGTFGDVSETVYDSHGMPLLIKFLRPTDATIAVEITLAANDQWTSEYEDQIKIAVAAAINAGEIGATVLITKLYSPAYLTGTAASESFDIVTLEIGKNAAPVAGINIPLDFDERPVCDPDTDVTVVVT